ncbi:hypothetical protein RHECNPAF_109004 [Rhizobium etli CNPAF512]|nr:hypothetical protein RHECNPAF_109004 [Rhizobium etli CNPAF512]
MDGFRCSLNPVLGKAGNTIPARRAVSPTVEKSLRFKTNLRASLSRYLWPHAARVLANPVPLKAHV